MASLQEYIDRAVDIAAGALDSPIQSADMLAESLVPEVLHDLTVRFTKDPKAHALFRITHTIPVTAGVGTLPDAVLSQYLCGADVLDANGDRATMCRYNTIVRNPDSRLAWFAQKENRTLQYLPVGGGSFTGNIFVTAATVPDKPTVSTAPILIPEEVLDEATRMLADRILLAAQQQSNA